MEDNAIFLKMEDDLYCLAKWKTPSFLAASMSFYMEDNHSFCLALTSPELGKAQPQLV
jgi:hypothetical protein